MRNQRGVTLIEVLIAVSLLSLLSVGMLMAMRVGLNALGKTNERLIDNRRVMGVERILEQQIAGFMPVMAMCLPGPGAPRVRLPFFQGEARAMRFVSMYSLGGAWRGVPQILEYLVIPRDDNRGVRLVVNEIPYTGALGAGLLCLGVAPEIFPPEVRYQPIEAGPHSFVLADRLAACRFLYLEPPPFGAPPDAIPQWRARWLRPAFPLGVRVEMEPLDPDPARLRPVTVTAPIRSQRTMETIYADY